MAQSDGMLTRLGRQVRASFTSSRTPADHHQPREITMIDDSTLQTLDRDGSVLITRDDEFSVIDAIYATLDHLDETDGPSYRWIFDRTSNESGSWGRFHLDVDSPSLTSTLERTRAEIDRRSSYLPSGPSPLTVVLNQPVFDPHELDLLTGIVHLGRTVRVRIVIVRTKNQARAHELEMAPLVKRLMQDPQPETDLERSGTARTEAQQLADKALALSATYLARIETRQLEQRSVEPEAMRSLQWLRFIATDAVDGRADLATLWHAFALFPHEITYIGDRTVDLAAQYVYQARALHAVNATGGA